MTPDLDAAKTIVGIVAAKRFCQMVGLDFSIESDVAVSVISAVNWALTVMDEDNTHTWADIDHLIELEGSIQ